MIEIKLCMIGIERFPPYITRTRGHSLRLIGVRFRRDEKSTVPLNTSCRGGEGKCLLLVGFLEATHGHWRESGYWIGWIFDLIQHCCSYIFGHKSDVKGKKQLWLSLGF